MAADAGTKRAKSRPNRREQQSLVFVDPLTDPLKQSQSAKNRHLIKKWSMLNRKNSHKPIANADVDGPEISVIECEQQGDSSTDRESSYDHREAQGEADPKELAARPCRRHSPTAILKIRNDDPFDILPTAMDKKSYALLYGYLNHHSVEYRPWFQPDDDYGELLVISRRQTWFPIARESAAACSSLLALVAAASPFQSEHAAIRDRYLAEAYSRTKAELASSKALANSTVLAVVMLALVALSMGDNQALESHIRGLHALLISRREKPRVTRKLISPEGYVFEPLASGHPPTFHGRGFERLYHLGLISQRAWLKSFKRAMTFNSLVLETPGDTFWWSAFAQHRWLMGDPGGLGMNACDKVISATMRLNWHMIVWQGALLTSPIVRGMILEIRTQLSRSDAEALLVAEPGAILWIALSAGPFALSLQDWFHKLLQIAIIASGYLTFEDALKFLEENYLWHHNLNAPARRFWAQSSAEVSARACHRPLMAGNVSGEAVHRMNIAFKALEFGGQYKPGLDTQNVRCRQCLCAWWV